VAYCRYHPCEHAGWHCLACQRSLCASCVPNQGLVSAPCPNCQTYLKFTGKASETVPFWQCLSDFFAYPLAPAPLVLITICTLLPALAGDGWTGLFIALFLTCAQTKYMYSVIEATANGELTPPSLGVAFSGGGLLLVLQQICILFAIVGLVFLAATWFGGGWAWVVMVISLTVLPASIMILATEHEISQALDVTRLAGFIRALGWPYFVMYGYILLLLLGMGAAQAFVMEHFRPALAYTFTGFVASYFLLIIFFMMGYVLLQYQHLLGGALMDDSPLGLAEKAVLTDKQAYTEIDIALKEGNFELAITALLSLFKRKPHDTHILNRLFRLLLATRKWEMLDKKSAPVLALLLETGRLKEIRQLLRGLYQQRPEFEVRDAQLSLRLAQSLYHAGEYRLLLRILKNFGERFHESDYEADVLELSARTLANGLQNPEKAAQYLRYLQKQFPHKPLAQNVPVLLESLQNIGRIPERRAEFTQPSATK